MIARIVTVKIDDCVVANIGQSGGLPDSEILLAAYNVVKFQEEHKDPGMTPTEVVDWCGKPDHINACNRKKYNKDPIVFARQNGRLL